MNYESDYYYNSNSITISQNTINIIIIVVILIIICFFLSNSSNCSKDYFDNQNFNEIVDNLPIQTEKQNIDYLLEHNIDINNPNINNPFNLNYFIS